jgi:hypothetical protein
LVFQKSTSSDAITCIFIISALFLTQEAMTWCNRIISSSQPQGMYYQTLKKAI